MEKTIFKAEKSGKEVTLRKQKRKYKKTNYEYLELLVPSTIKDELVLKKGQKLDVYISKVPWAIILKIKEKDFPTYNEAMESMMNSRQRGRLKKKKKIVSSERIRKMKWIEKLSEIKKDSPNKEFIKKRIKELEKELNLSSS